MSAVCGFDGCDRPVKVKKHNLCHAHYQQMWLGRPLTPIKENRRLRQPSKDTKVCTECFQVKSLDKDFYKRTNGRPQSKCKECMRDYAQRRRDAQKAEEGS